MEITAESGQGQQIPASAIKEVQINADSDVHYVAWQFANRVTGVFAAVQIPAGTLLTPSMTTATSNLTTGKVEVGLSLKPGQAPTNLLIGQTVQAFPVGNGSGCARRGQRDRHRDHRHPRRVHHHRHDRQRDRHYLDERQHRRGHPRRPGDGRGHPGLLRLGR